LLKHNQINLITGGASIKKRNAESESSRLVPFFKRTASASMLAILFAVILRATRQTGCGLLLVFLQVGMYKEVVDIIADKQVEANLPGFNKQKYLWLLSFVQFIYGKILEHEIMEVAPPVIAHNFHAVHNMFSYALWVTIILRFVLSMHHSKYLRYQISQLAGCVLAIIVLVVQSCMGVATLRAGLFWFVFPVLLVITNDSAAYIFGKTMGKTPLIKLSPNKTREGFIGGLFATAIASFVLAGFLGSQRWLTCPRNLLPGPAGDCADAPLYIWSPFSTLLGKFKGILPPFLAQIQVMPVQLHSICFALFASLIAPFHGFFASAVKRAFDVKDFGSSIPGHGGILDRMDCQVMMVGFSYMYLQSFLPDLLDHSRL